MEEFIPQKHIPKSLDGAEDWTYSYVEPSPDSDENAKLSDTETRDRLLAARAQLYKAYEDATMEWIQAGEDKTKVAEAKKKREEVAERLREDYWGVDPYLRARSYYDRIGVLLPGGRLNWYPEAGEKREGEGVNGSKDAAAAAPVEGQTSADDLD